MPKSLWTEDPSTVSAQPASFPPANAEAPALQEQSNHTGEQYQNVPAPDLSDVNGLTFSKDTLDPLIDHAESAPLSPANADALFGSEVELVIAPPVEADTLRRFCQWLKAAAKAEIQETVGSWQEGTFLKILLTRPLPLLDMLTSSPDVLQAWEKSAEAQEKSHRFLVRRKKAPHSIGGPTRRLHVALKSNSTPKQLAMSFDSPIVA